MPWITPTSTSPPASPSVANTATRTVNVVQAAAFPEPNYTGVGWSMVFCNLSRSPALLPSLCISLPLLTISRLRRLLCPRARRGGRIVTSSVVIIFANSVEHVIIIFWSCLPVLNPGLGSPRQVAVHQHRSIYLLKGVTPIRDLPPLCSRTLQAHDFTVRQCLASSQRSSALLTPQHLG
jgi:hypothetical protein